MKNWKTALLGAIGLVYLTVGLILVAYKVFTLTELSSSLAVVGIFLTSILGIVAKRSTNL